VEFCIINFNQFPVKSIILILFYEKYAKKVRTKHIGTSCCDNVTVLCILCIFDTIEVLQFLMLPRSSTSLNCSEEPRAQPSSMIIDLPVISGKGWSSLDEGTGKPVKGGRGSNIRKKGYFCNVSDP